MKKKKNIIGIVLYLILVFAVTLLFLWYIAQDSNRYNDFYLAMFIPATVALLINIFFFRSISVVFEPVFHKISIRAVLFSFLYPFVFIGIIALVVFFSGLGTFNAEEFSVIKESKWISVILMGILLVFGEEYGWRGFLLNNLNKIFTKNVSTLINGVVWGLWHVPIVLFLTRILGKDNAFLLTFVQFLAVFLVSFPFAYIYFEDRSIVPPILIHLFWNIINPVILGDIYTNEAGFIAGNLFYINGETVAGLVLGIPMMFYFMKKMRET